MPPYWNGLSITKSEGHFSILILLSLRQHFILLFLVQLTYSLLLTPLSLGFPAPSWLCLVNLLCRLCFLNCPLITHVPQDFGLSHFFSHSSHSSLFGTIHSMAGVTMDVITVSNLQLFSSFSQAPNSSLNCLFSIFTCVLSAQTEHVQNWIKFTIREMQIKSMMRYHFTPTKMARIKKITISVVKDGEKLEPSYTAGRNTKWCILKNRLTSLKNVKHRATIWHSSSTLRYTPKRDE